MTRILYEFLMNFQEIFGHDLDYALLSLLNVEYVSGILHNVIKASNQNNPYAITIYMDSTMASNILGAASWSTGEIWLNANINTSIIGEEQITS